MDKLKDFIDAHREAFDNDLLPEGHLARFEKKLKPKRRLRKLAPAIVTIAAATAALLILLKTQSNISPAPQQGTTFICEAEEEIEELRLYYNMQIYDVETQIKDLHSHRQTPGSSELMQATEHIIRTSCEFEENILPTLPCSEAALFAMNQHYGNSLQSLNLMLRQMQRVINSNYSN
jgi:hypothetical protein